LKLGAGMAQLRRRYKSTWEYLYPTTVVIVWRPVATSFASAAMFQDQLRGR
jgi:hypothetical protein